MYNEQTLTPVDQNQAGASTSPTRTKRRHQRSGSATNSQELRDLIEKRADCYPAPLGQVLYHASLITSEQLDRALRVQTDSPGARIGQVLQLLGYTSEENVQWSLARKFGLPFVKLDEFDVDPSLLTLVPAALARRHGAFPLLVFQNRLVVAVSDPVTGTAIDELRFVSGRNIELAVATASDISRLIADYYGEPLAENTLAPWEEQITESDTILDAKELEAASRDHPIVRLVDHILEDAISRGASDAHLCPTETQVELFLRIDGELKRTRSFKKSLLAALVARFKVIGGMDLSQHRVPQDGRARFHHNGASVDLRFSVVPTVKGESVVIRVLNARTALRTIDELGYSRQDQRTVENILQRRCGLLLVTGPTGSGKSTTLYAAMNVLRQRGIKVVSVEDPVEYHMDGIDQLQVNHPAGFTFPKALRHVLRHDPDAIVVGEIRDRDTAAIAIESAMTGHIVLSTLHTNNAAGSIARLLEMGVEPYSLKSALLGVVAQRLVRRNCRHCMEIETVPLATRDALGVAADEPFYCGRGCSHCNRTGYDGRATVYELLNIDATMRHYLGKEGIDAIDIESVAIDNGMRPLLENALTLARRGVISLSEAARIRAM